MSQSDPDPLSPPVRRDGDDLRSDTMARMMRDFIAAGALNRVSVRHLVLSDHAREGLSRVAIENLQQLVDASDEDLARTRYLDAATLAEIRAEQRRVLGTP